MTLLLCSSVWAQGLGVSPAKLDLSILRGHQGSLHFTAFNPTDHPIDFVVYNKELSSWFEFEPTQGSIAPNSYKEIKVMVKPDELASNGIYDTLIYVGLDRDKSKEGVALDIGTAIKTKLKVTGKQIISVYVRNIKVENAEQDGQAVFAFDLQNNGNVKLKPYVLIKIKRNMVVINEFLTELEEILPGENKKMYAEWSTANKEVGVYDAFVQVMVNQKVVAEKILGFDVLPYGMIDANGELVELKINGNNEGLVKVSGLFKNTGNTAVKAKLMGEIYSKDSLIGKFESEPLLVASLETIELDAYIKAEDGYQIKAHVLYNQKQTPAKIIMFSKPSNNQPIFGSVITVSIVVFGYLGFEGYRKIKK